MVNLSNEKLSEEEKSILAKGLTFIPTPIQTDLDSITESVNAFKRRVKLTYFWADKSLKDKYDNDRERIPFTAKTGWEAPDKKIDVKVHTKLAELENKVSAMQPCIDQPNLTKTQIGALRSLRQKKHLILKKADKGSACVIMNKQDYILEAERQLNNPRHYRKINEPIYPKTAKEIRSILQKLGKNKVIAAEQVHYLLPDPNPRPRHFYLLPKIHKDQDKWTIPGKMPPGRPIVSDCGSESYHVSEYIDYHLKPIADKHPSYIKDTYDFLAKIADIKVPKNALLITLDIESLYTNIQTTDGLKSVEKMFAKYPKSQYIRPEKEILELLKLNLDNNDFMFRNEWYLQISGTAMGKRFAPTYANIDMAIFEEEVLALSPKKPLAYFRFLDDIFCIWPHSKDEFFQFFDLLNNHRESIKFQYTISEDSVDFLDVTVYKGPNFADGDKLDTKVYFKPTDTHELLHKSSFHPKHTFEGILKSQLIRFFKICSNTDNFNQACSTLFQALSTRRGYSKRFLRTIKAKTVDLLEKCRNNIAPVGAALPCGKRRCECCLYFKPASDFSSKHTLTEFTITGRLTCESANIVYLIECKKCEEQYVGETSRSLKTRLGNHVSNIRGYKDTAVAEHFNQIDHDGNLDLEITPILQIQDQGSKVKNMLTRRKYETFFIRKLDTMTPNGMNLKLEDFGVLPFPIKFGHAGAQVAKLAREIYSELQEELPRHFKDKFVTAFKRNKNLKDMLVSSKLKD